MNDNLRIVFMGTPDFAVESLKILHESGINIVGVITSTDKWGGRGRKQLIESSVKKYAVSEKLHVLQPPNLKDPNFIEELRSLKADLQVVVAFRMLPELVWNMPPKGTINLHASLLPDYRGAAPINWAIINGEKETGVTTFRLKHEIDTGDILFKSKVSIDVHDTAGSLHDKLMVKGAELIKESVIAIANGSAEFSPQRMKGDHPEAPKIFLEDCEINFQQEVKKVYDFIRGLDPYPGAWTSIDDMIIKCYDAEIGEPTNSGKAGQIERNAELLIIHCNDGRILIRKVKAEGKRKMSARDWLNGYTIEKYKAGK